MTSKLVRILTPTWQVAWVLTLVTLPVTSFPLLSKAAGGTLVAPLAMLPLIWLCLTYLPVYVLSRKPMPAEAKPLFVFVIVALIASAAAVFVEIPPFKGYTIASNVREGIITLGIGLAFFLITVLMTTTSKALNTALFLLNIGGIVLLLWSLLQIVVSYMTVGGFPDWMAKIQSFISITEIQMVGSRFRVPGTTLEPSWLAHALNILYLSLWLGSTAARYSAFRFRVFKITMENFLLVGGIIVLIFTYSRIGLLAFSLVMLWFVILGGRALASRFSRRLFKNKPAMRTWMQILFTMVLVPLLILAVGGLAYRLSLDDPRFAQFFEMESGDYPARMNIFVFANRLQIAERVVAWDLGWKVFEQHPVLGVGLGNVGMFTMKDLSYYAWKLPEVMRVIYREATLPNSKNLWIRILAETGTVGFAVFSTWLVILWMAARRLHKDASPLLRALGLMGQFSLLALLLEGFSVDTFALPFIWISLGLITAASFVRRQESSKVPVPQAG